MFVDDNLQPPSMDYIEAWLEALPVAQIEQEMEQLQQRINEWSFQINARRDVLEMHKRWAMYYGPDSPYAQERAAAAAATAEADRPEQSTEEPDDVAAGDIFGSHTPPATPPSPPKYPGTIAKGVLALMTEAPDREWDVGEIYGTMTLRDWIEHSQQSERSLSASLSRMVSNGEIVRVRRGVYAPARLALPGEAATISSRTTVSGSG